MRILFFSLFELPDSCAAATRVMNLVKMIQPLGYDVEVLGITDDPNAPLEGVYDGIQYKALRTKRAYGYRAYERIIQLKKDLKRYFSAQEPYDVIILSNVYYDYADVFMRCAKKTGAKLVVNAVEWYEKDNDRFAGLNGKINFVKNRIALRYLHKKMGNILAISSLLDDYYRARGCNTVTVPTVVDLKEYAEVSAAEKTFGETVRVAYAGSPAKKDYIVNAIKAVALLSEEERSRLRLDFYGAKTEQLYRLGLSPDFIETYGENVVCHGRIPYAEVKARIAAADFTVLLRPDKRYANAGFPTKVGESMACGTPVIANITSDLGKYILDGKTGIVCRDETPEACADAFRRALDMTAEERAAMRAEALAMAHEAFDYRVYTTAMGEFLENLK